MTSGAKFCKAPKAAAFISALEKSFQLPQAGPPQPSEELETSKDPPEIS